MASDRLDPVMLFSDELYTSVNPLRDVVLLLFGIDDGIAEKEGADEGIGVTAGRTHS